MPRSDEDERARGRTPAQRLLWTPTKGQDDTKSYFPLSEGASLSARVREVVARHASLFISEIVELSGVPEAKVRAVLDEMAASGEGYWARDLPRNEDVFTASPVNMGKLAVERRIQDRAAVHDVAIKRMEWAPSTEDGERAFTLSVTSDSETRTAPFTRTELEEIAEGEENKDIIDSRLFNLVSRHKVRRIL